MSSKFQAKGLAATIVLDTVEEDDDEDTVDGGAVDCGKFGGCDAGSGADGGGGGVYGFPSILP